MLKKMAVAAGEALADYHFGESHPFGPDRHQAFLAGMGKVPLQDAVQWVIPVFCDESDLEKFHHQKLIQHVKNHSLAGQGYLDQGDTPARKGIYEAACFVVGTVLHLTDLIMTGEIRRGFSPIAGLHHSGRGRCSGFCVFNDIGVAIEHLRQQYSLKKILYVDIDAHHGDGVFYSYENDPDIFIVDFHEDGKYLYPGTGNGDETGTGAAKGTKMNLPMPPGAGDEFVRSRWPAVEDFIHENPPEFIILQCGADSMDGDPITHMCFSEATFSEVTTRLVAMAEQYCNGRMLALGGGGYNLNNIAKAWPAVVAAMLE